MCHRTWYLGCRAQEQESEKRAAFWKTLPNMQKPNQCQKRTEIFQANIYSVLRVISTKLARSPHLVLITATAE